MTQRPVEKAINEIYEAYHKMCAKRSKRHRKDSLLERTEPVTLTDAIFHILSLNFGNTSMTGERINRVFSSAHFLSFTHERRH